MRPKNRNDYNHGKDGYCSGNPRYGKKKRAGKGSSAQKPDRAKDRAQARRAMAEVE